MQAEPLIQWSEVVTEYVSFAASFLAAGAVGFRYSSLRGRLAGSAPAGATPESEQRVYADSAARAAGLGLLGALVSAVLLALRLPEIAARRHMTAGQLVTGDLPTGVQVALLAVAVVGFALAWRRVGAGWPLAAAGVVLAAFRGILSGQWARLVNPLHVLSAGLWIGTLFVLVVCGIARLLREEPVRERRGAIAADMVNAFSPLALVCGALVALFGVITAWRHLKHLDALWTTPYGYGLIAKLCVVAVVFGLGAWNWRRQRPTLGSEEAAVAIRRSARAELIAAAVVLAVTAVLVSLPAPR